MEFIKRHYEKLLLAGFLVIFISSMVYLAGIMKTAGSVTQDDLKLKKYNPDFNENSYFAGKVPAYETEEKKIFDLDRNLNGFAPWGASKSRVGSKYQDFYSDLVVTFAAARCGHEDCDRVIPLFYFGQGKKIGACPWCGGELKAPPKRDMLRTGVVTADDPDGCGIPHHVKREYNLAEDDPGNVLDDLDKDGFSNLYEYRQKTALNNAMSHPPMWHRLVVEKIERVKVPLQLKAVMASDPKDKTKWDIQINRLDTETEKTMFTMLNDRLTIDGVEYTIKDVQQVKVESKGSSIDKSYIDVVSDAGVRIRMQIGQDVYTPDAKACLRDLGTNRLYTLGVGQELRLGTRKTGRVRYLITNIDQEKKRVMLQDNFGANKGKMLPEPITRRGKIRMHERIREQQSRPNSSMPDMPGM